MPLIVDQTLLTQLTAELGKRGIRMLFAETKERARETILGMIPHGATVMAGSSRTLGLHPRRRARAEPGRGRGSGGAARGPHPSMHR